MTFIELAEKLGSSGHLPLPDGYYPAPSARSNELCSLDLINSLQSKYNLFGEFYDSVVEGFSDILKDPLRKAYLDSITLYHNDVKLEDALKIKYPPSVDTPASNMLPFLVHLPAIDSLYDGYRKRGLSHEEAVKALGIYAIYLREERAYRSKITGISPAISNWISRFTKQTIIYFGDAGLNFQLSKAAFDFPTVLKNRENGHYVILSSNGYPVHKSGIPLGSKGAESREGSFVTEFKETDDAYIGHTASSRYISAEPTVFNKDEWDIILKPGDDIISIHIFFDADFTPESVDHAIDHALERLFKAYPKYDFKALYCCSWLMSPDVNDVLGEESRLSKFSSRFVRFPVVSSGNLVHGCVFPNNRGQDVSSYDENTSLQRKFKKILMDGKYVYEAAGIIPII